MINHPRRTNFRDSLLHQQSPDHRRHFTVPLVSHAIKPPLLVATRICPLAANRSFTVMNAQSGEFEVRLNYGSHV